jgi:hypothetical protein
VREREREERKREKRKIDAGDGTQGLTDARQDKVFLG